MYNKIGNALYMVATTKSGVPFTGDYTREEIIGGGSLRY